MKWKGEAAALPELSARPAHPRSASQGRGECGRVVGGVSGAGSTGATAGRRASRGP